MKREFAWETQVVPIGKEIELLESGVLVRRGEFGKLYNDRLDEVNQVCQRLGMTLNQGLLIRKQLLVSQVMSSAWKLKDERKVKHMIRKFQSREQSLLEISREMNLPPVSIFRAVLASRVYEAHKDWRASDRKRLVSSIISEKSPENIENFLSEWELEELQKAKAVDDVGFGEATASPELWEQALYGFLDEQQIEYVTEETLREAEMQQTPDCLILDDWYINDQLVRWIDVKSFYGSGLRQNKPFSKKLKKQIERYETEFGESGAVVFKHGFSSELRNNHPSTLFLDAGPLARYSDFDDLDL